MFSASRLGRALLPWAVAAPLALSASTAAYADYDLAVTWPTATRINPDAASYPISVSDTGPGDLYADWQGDRQAIPHSGEVTLDLPTDGVDAVTIVRCDPSCVSTGVLSPSLSVYRALHFEGAATWGPGAPGATENVPLQISPNPDATPVDLTWTLRSGPAGTDPVIATGTPTVTPDAGGHLTVPVAVPPGASEGTAWLEVTGSTTLADFGALSGSTGAHEFVIDTPAVLGLTLSETGFYPVVDGYLDTVEVGYSANEAVDYRLEVLDGADPVRLLDQGSSFSGSGTVVWNGRDDSSTRVPAGTYTVRFRGTDSGGNVTTATKQILVGDEHLAMVTATSTYTPKKTLWGKFVGPCSTLAAPSSHGWAGSFGYYSQTRCTKARQSAVLTYQAWWVPEAINGKYGAFKVSTYGGKPQKAKYSYLVTGYLRASDDVFTNRAQFTGTLGWHNGPSTSITPFLRYQSGHPYVAWAAGLTGGARFDVKSFKVSVTYQALVAPSGKVVSPRMPSSVPRVAVPKAGPAEGLAR